MALCLMYLFADSFFPFKPGCRGALLNSGFFYFQLFHSSESVFLFPSFVSCQFRLIQFDAFLSC